MICLRRLSALLDSLFDLLKRLTRPAPSQGRDALRFVSVPFALRLPVICVAFSASTISR